MRLHTFDTLPDGFLDMDLRKACSSLPGPSLIHLPGDINPPLFVATLLHGNEPTGLQAIQKLLRQYQASGQNLPRSLTIFIGNISAAEKGLRHLAGQPDYNRIWKEPGPGQERTPEHKMIREVTDRMKTRGVFASIDIHNTSGRNPHYACVNRLDSKMIHLGGLFSRILVYFTRPSGVQSMAFAEFCPAITIEAGRPGEESGVRHVSEFLEVCLRLKTLPDNPVRNNEGLNIYHSIARIRLPKNSSIGFDGDRGNFDFRFIGNLDAINFTDFPAHSLLGWRLNSDLKLSVIDDEGKEVENNFISYENGEIRLKRSVVPSMFTMNERVIYQDCLGYLMERYVIQ